MKAKGYTKETIVGIGVEQRGFPSFNIGDTIAISLQIKEGDKERIQVFQGDVIARKSNGASSTFTVRKMGAHSIAVERIFPYYSPKIKEIKIVKRGDVCRAKLYYVRDRIGKSARIKELVLTKEQKAKRAAADVQLKADAQASLASSNAQETTPEAAATEPVETKK